MPVRLQTARRAARVRSVSNTTLFIPVQVTQVYVGMCMSLHVRGFLLRSTVLRKNSLQKVALLMCRDQLTNASLQDFCTSLEFCFILF